MDLLQLETDLKGDSLETHPDPEPLEAAPVAMAAMESSPRSMLVLHHSDDSSRVAGPPDAGSGGSVLAQELSHRAGRLRERLAALRRRFVKETSSFRLPKLQGNEPQMLAWLLAAIGLPAAYCAFATRNAPPEAVPARARTATFGQNPDQDPSEWADDDVTMAMTMTLEQRSSILIGHSGEDGEQGEDPEEFLRALVSKNLSMGTGTPSQMLHKRDADEYDAVSTDEEDEQRFA